MRILLLSNYFFPETVGAGIWVWQLARDLRSAGHQMTVLTSFPSYPAGRIFPGYRNGLASREHIEDIEVIRTWTLATASKSFRARFASFGAFCASALVSGLSELPRADVVYAILPPLPLGVSGWALASANGASLVVNVQDIYPDIAEATGFLTNRPALRFFRRMERWVYREAARVVVISEGFRENLLAKGVHTAKIAVVPNWADPESIRPGAKENAFRSELGLDGSFVVLYSGGLTHNSRLDPLLDAAHLLAGERFMFVIVGEGVRKDALERKSAELGLRNVRFLPFQPLERYGEVLAAADVTLVTLDSAATFASVPSKIYKQMAAGRPIVAVTKPGNELTRLIAASGCGVTVPPDDPDALAAALLRASKRPHELLRFGENARAYLERECSRAKCVAAIERVLLDACAEHRRAGA